MSDQITPVEFIAEWVEALRSGEYEQGRNHLHTIVDGDHEFCCLGVACDVAVKHGLMETLVGPTVVEYHWTGPTIIPDDQSWRNDVLPEPMARWLGIQANPILDVQAGSTASWLNDEEGATFERIADLIEATIVPVVTA